MGDENLGYMSMTRTSYYSPCEVESPPYSYEENTRDQDAILETHEYGAPIKVPELPAEMWTKIFAFATRIPGAFDLEDTSAIAGFTRDHHGICINNRYQAVMRTKTAATLVCKYWNNIIQRYLFEYIRIKSGAQACLAAEALRNAPGNLGEKTLRIDIALEGAHIWTNAHRKAIFQILESCPNLVCFSTAFSTDEPSVYTHEALFETLACHRHLKRLEIKVDYLRTMAVLEKVLGDRLQVLWLVPHRLHLPPKVLAGQEFHFPKLHTLVTLRCGENFTRYLEVPNLRACIMEQSASSTLPLCDKGKIKYVRIRSERLVIAHLQQWSSLETFSIHYNELAHRVISWPTEFQQSKLQCIMIENVDYGWGIQGTTVAAASLMPSSFDHLQENLLHLISQEQFPRLRCARIFLPLQRSSSVCLDRVKHIWRIWLRECKFRGIRIEVSLGQEESTADYWTEITHQEMFELL
jgi:hypothetical protein